MWFDVANGRTGHLRWDTFDRIIEAGFWPDTISTDGSTTSPTAESVIDFPNVLSKFLNFGMTLDQVVARATVNASRIFPLFHDRGTLNVGAPADVAVFELREGTFEFVDNYGNSRTGGQRLFPSETVLGGERMPGALRGRALAVGGVCPLKAPPKRFEAALGVFSRRLRGIRCQVRQELDLGLLQLALLLEGQRPPEMGVAKSSVAGNRPLEPEAPRSEDQCLGDDLHDVVVELEHEMVALSRLRAGQVHGRTRRGILEAVPAQPGGLTSTPQQASR